MLSFEFSESCRAQHARSTMAMALVARVSELKKALDEAKERLTEKKKVLEERKEELERTKRRTEELEEETEKLLETTCQLESRVNKEKALTKVLKQEWSVLKTECESCEERVRNTWKEAFVEIPRAFARECRKFQEFQAQADFLEWRRQADSECMRITCEMRRMNKEIDCRKETTARREEETLSLEKEVCEQAATNESKRTKVSLLANELRKLNEAHQRISEEGRVFDFQGKESSIRKMEEEAAAHQNAVQQLHKQMQSYRKMEEQLKSMVASKEVEVLGRANTTGPLSNALPSDDQFQDASATQRDRPGAPRPLTSMRKFGVRKRGKAKTKDTDAHHQDDQRPSKPPLAFVPAAMDPFGGMRH